MQDKYNETGDLASLSGLNNPSYSGFLCLDLQQYEELFDAAASAVEAVKEGKLSSSEAAKKILSVFDRSDFVPSCLNFMLPIVATNANLILTILSIFLLGANLLYQRFNSFASNPHFAPPTGTYSFAIGFGVVRKLKLLFFPAI